MKSTPPDEFRTIPRGVRQLGLVALLAATLCGPRPASAEASRPLLSRPDLFQILAAEKNVQAYRLEGFRKRICDSLSFSTSSPFECYDKRAEVRSRSRKAVPSLIELLAPCTWVRYPVGLVRREPTLGFHFGGDSLAVDLVVWLDWRRAVLSRKGEGWYTAEIPQGLVTDVVWCLWGADPANMDLSEQVGIEMNRRGSSLEKAPPSDIKLVDDITPRAEDVLVTHGDKISPQPGDPRFVMYEEPPTPVRQVQPVYPERARKDGIQGRVVLHALVGKDGRVRRIHVTRSVPGLDEAAVDAVKHWVFKPALQGNSAVRAWAEVPVDFHF